MSDATLKALVLLPGEEGPFDKVQAIIGDCLDLADFQLLTLDYEKDENALWVDVEGALDQAHLLVADFSHICPSCTGPDYDIVVKATIARFKYQKPVLVCFHGPVVDALPLGWHSHADTYAYSPDDEGMAFLRKALLRRLMELAKTIPETLAGTTPAVPTAPRTPATAAPPAPDPAPAASAADAVDREAELKRLFQERFRQSLSASDDAVTAPAAATPQAPVKPAPVAAPAAPASAKPAPAATAEKPKPLGKPTVAAEDKKASRLLELQERLRRKQDEERTATAAASAPMSASDDDMPFDLNIDLGGDAPAIVTGRAEKKGPVGSSSDHALTAAAAAAAIPSEDDLPMGDDDDDDDDFDIDDIDILKEIKREQRHGGKKKKKLKSKAKLDDDVPVAVPPESRKGLGALQDKRTGRSLALRKLPLSLGRVAGNEIIIPEGAISKNHARITRDGDTYYIEDLQTTNGTWVNDTRVVVRTALRHGDRIILAKTSEFPNGAREFTFHQEI